MSKFTKLLFIAPLLLAACAQPESADGAADAAVTSSFSDVMLEVELARPQPEKPICAVCQVDPHPPPPPPPQTGGNAELSMTINASYVGLIEDLYFIVYTETDVTTHSFDSSVIDDLNNTATSETIVMMDIPGIMRGLLVFEFADSTHYEPVYVD